MKRGNRDGKHGKKHRRHKLATLRHRRIKTQVPEKRALSTEEVAALPEEVKERNPALRTDEEPAK
jgi:hypothetical protein